MSKVWVYCKIQTLKRCFLFMHYTHPVQEASVLSVFSCGEKRVDRNRLKSTDECHITVLLLSYLTLSLALCGLRGLLYWWRGCWFWLLLLGRPSPSRANFKTEHIRVSKSHSDKQTLRLKTEASLEHSNMLLMDKNSASVDSSPSFQAQPS